MAPLPTDTALPQDVVEPAGPNAVSDAPASFLSDAVPLTEAHVPIPAEPAPEPAPAKADQIDQVEARLAALFQALDRTPERAAPAVEASPLPSTPEPSILAVEQPVEAVAAPEAKRAALLQNTAMSSSPALEQAIAEIAARQAYLDRTSEDQAPIAEGSGSVAADLLHRYGAARTRRASRERLDREVVPDEDLPVASDAPAQPARPAEPALFAGLQAEISGLSRRIEDIHQKAGLRDATLAKEATVGELRTKLGGLSGKTLDSLGDRVEALAAKIDVAIEDRLSPSAIERLVSGSRVYRPR